jgi:hypothetical protein
MSPLSRVFARAVLAAATGAVALASPRVAGAQVRVNPTSVNVSTQTATTVFLSYGGLRPDQVLAEAVWCGDVISAAPDIGMKCNPASLWGQLPLRYDHAVTSGVSGFTDIMSIPASVARRAYASAATGAQSDFFYVRRVVSNAGRPSEYVVLTCRPTGGGAGAPLSLTDVQLAFTGDQSVLFVRPGQTAPSLAAEIIYTGTGRLVGRWEIVRPGEELPSETDRLTEATLPIEQRPTQRRYSQLERFNVFLPPSGHVTLRGPDPSRLPTDVDGLYLVLLRIEVSDDDAGDSNLSAVGSGTGIVHAGAVAGFPLPVLRYVVGPGTGLAESTRETNAVRLLLPRGDTTVARGVALTFGWVEAPGTGAAYHRLEIQRDDGEPVHSAIVPRGIGTYRAPPWLADKAAGQPLRWRVVALDESARERNASAWRPLRFTP